jgi:hypothetical protein
MARRHRRRHGSIGRLARGFACACLVLLGCAGPAWARVVGFTSAAPLPDTSDASLERAIRMAVDQCVQEATAMGLSWIALHDATVKGDSIVIHMVATDEESEGDAPASEDAQVPEDVRVIDLLSGARVVQDLRR